MSGSPPIWAEGWQPPAADRSWMYGEGLFETMRLQGGRAFRPEAHLARLQRSAGDLGLPLPEPAWQSRLLAAVARRAADMAPAVGRARVTLTAGAPPADGDPAAVPRGPGRLLLTCSVLAQAPPLPPVRLALAGPPTGGRRDALSAHKTLSYLANLLCLRQAQRLGADEGLMAAADGRLVGGARANLFLVRRGGLLTPGADAGARPGVAREAIVEEIAPALGLSCQAIDLVAPDLITADEIFLSSAVRGVVPVSALLRPAWIGAAPGPITLRIQKAYESMVASAAGTG